MRALTVRPGHPSSALLEDRPEPPRSTGGVLIEAIAVGICGTDREILAGEYGEAPPGEARLILGHESLGRVVEAPPGSGLARGDLVAGIVREPDPVPCSNCAVGEWDMCRNGRYREHGIKGLHGFAAERFRLEVPYAVKLAPELEEIGVLLEPASVVAKAWEHIDRISARSAWAPRRVLVTGAGPIGLLGALIGRQRELEVHVLDRAEGGPKPKLVADLGARYHPGPVEEVSPEADIILECTGAPTLIFAAMLHGAPNGIVCLAGVTGGKRVVEVDAAALNRELVLENNVVFGTVNANRRHYEAAAGVLARADRAWLRRLITRRVPLEHWREALEARPDDVKTVLTFGA